MPDRETHTPSESAETYAFQAETRQLLDIVIHSLYSNKEIFLRELISNASDALDRRRFEALTDKTLLSEDTQLRIRLETDAEARTLTLDDNGIGMNRQEVIDNIGTIAKSGTRELMDRLAKNPNPEATAELIGRFGVGFYSAFMVADRITLVTRRAGEEEATRWESSGDGTYSLDEGSLDHVGTRITLHLTEADPENGIEDFADFHVLEEIVKKHSDFVAYPILAEEMREEPGPEILDAEGKPIPGPTQSVGHEVTLNSRVPIWTRPAEQVTEEEYAEFYRHISHDWNPPLDTLSLRAEGRIEYRALLFLPKKAPYDLFYRDTQWGLRLYVKRVLIMENCDGLLPAYLRFVRGIVDSADLPLNISREMVQQDRHINQMRKWLTKKVLDHLAQIQREDEEKYLSLWKEFGRVLKEGLSMDQENQKRLLPILYFASSHDETQLTTLDAYLERMKEGQEEIFFLTGESRNAVESSPHLEAFREKGYEVLYLVDPVDEIVIQSVFEYEGKRLKSVGKGSVELGTEEEKKEAEENLAEKSKEFGDLMTRLQKLLGDTVKEVRLSTRLTTSPVCLVADEHDMSPNLERLLRQSEGADIPVQKRILELNPQHELLTKLQARFQADPVDPVLDDYAQLLLAYGLIAEGSDLPNPAAYNKLVGKLMLQGL
jgi:molecular chaperone HtpG